MGSALQVPVSDSRAARLCKSRRCTRMPSGNLGQNLASFYLMLWSAGGSAGVLRVKTVAIIDAPRVHAPADA